MQQRGDVETLFQEGVNVKIAMVSIYLITSDRSQDIYQYMVVLRI
jgi:hypothetical protein